MALEEARRALDGCEWERAYALLAASDPDDPVEAAERHDLLADACWWLGRLEECIDARQRAYTCFETLGLHRRAARAAVWCYEHHCFMARPAIGGAWLQRARRALDGDEECAEWAHLQLREAEVAHGHGDLARALECANAALDLGRRLREPDVEGEALQAAGRILVDAGRPEDGLAHLDEAMLLAVEGRMGPYSTGKVYCSMIGACEDLGDLRRAAEWTDATIAWSNRHPFAVFPGLCRVKRAGVLQRRGEWAEAEREARRACEELAGIKVNTAAAAWVEVGEIRRRIGDLGGAEEAFGRAQDLCCTPAAGLALLRLAQGRLDAAVSMIEGALADESWNRLARARLLPAKVQIALQVPDLDAAAAAAAELDAIAQEYGTPLLVAEALVARGRVELGSGRAQPATNTLRQAVDAWNALDVPYEVATAQALLGRACAEVGDRDGAARWSAAAAATFDRLGAAYDARDARSVSARDELPAGLTAREAEVLRLVAEGCTNKEIAARLVLSEKTVARHLSNIFTKIGVATRAGATAFAFENGIVGTRV